jgi:hypothetical protein
MLLCPSSDRAGGHITRFRLFQEHAEALEAVGLRD